MKHLKIYENNSDKLWLVCSEFSYDPESNHQELFQEKESAINQFLIYVNNEAKDQLAAAYEVIVDLDEAYAIIDELDGVDIYFYELGINEKCELPEYIKIAANIKKYNL